ncbi:MAG: hypothetical protein IGS48_13925 [Oscillatoriales cyanobacterium C42_A2020_001]|nr:hypothetical protein [Leptolyngbyaceae cyanobacterium C42_A2020_001]
MSTKSLHKPTHHANHESLWCPKCQDYGLVYCDHNDEDLWKCVYCNYQVNLTKGTRSSGSGESFEFPWEVFFAAIIVFLFMFFAKEFALERQFSQRFDDRGQITLPANFRWWQRLPTF